MAIPNWLFDLLVLLSLPAVLIICVFVWEQLHPPQINGSPNWHTYRSDVFFGLRWHWDYCGHGNIDEIFPFCPYRDFQVFPYNVSSFRAIDRIGFRHDSCDRALRECDESIEFLKSKVKQFVHKNLGMKLGMQKTRPDKQLKQTAEKVPVIPLFFCHLDRHH
jgi:hypothetical protein